MELYQNENNNGQKYSESQARMRNDPILFFDYMLNAEHWSKQDDIIESVFKHQRTTVASCHGI